MSMEDDYRVVTTGRILDGFDANEVQKQLVAVLRMNEAQAERFLDKPRVVKKGVSWASADKICGQLAMIGVAAEIQNPAPEAEAQPAEEQRPMNQESELQLVEDEPKAEEGVGTVECPNCGHVQAKAEQCENCGIWFHKFEAPDVSPQPARVQQAAPVAAAASTAAASEPTNTATTTTTTTEADSLSPVAIGAAAGAALVGALIWKFIAVTFGYEYGVIAWAIGGAVGFAAHSAGSRGMQAGVVCAVLVFGSIIIGKYWTYSAFVDEFEGAFAELSEYDDDMVAYYEEELEDARLFVRGSGTDIFVRRFMVERGYSYATNPADVSDLEVAEFREYVEPSLREMAANPPDISEWQEAQAEFFDEISPWAMMKEDFGLLDVVFLFLGIGTAFRIAHGGDE